MRPHASIKLVNISFALFSIVISAGLATFLATISGDQALSDCQALVDDSVEKCFESGKSTTIKGTEEYLRLLMKTTVAFIENFVEPHTATAVSIAGELMTSPWDDIKRFEWHRLERYWWEFNTSIASGNTALGLFLSNGLTLYYIENENTMNRSKNEFHDLSLLMNYGNGHPWGGENRTFYTSAESGTGRPAGVVNPLLDVNWDPLAECEDYSHRTDGAVHDDPCVVMLDVSMWLRSLVLTDKPFTGVLLTPPVSFGPFVTTNTVAPIFHGGIRTGYVILCSDLRQISRFLQEIDPQSKFGRTFITVRGWIEPGYDGYLVAASHGNFFLQNRENMNGPYKGATLITPRNSTDAIIRLIGAKILDLNLNSIATSEMIVPLDLDGVDFFYNVAFLKNNYGLDWFVHVVIDREYILGTFDKTVIATQETIRAAEETTDRQLRRNRSLHAVAVVVLTAVMIVVSVVFTIKVIEPFIILEKEMAMVAVMKLESVDTDRPLSALQEVRKMQISFLSMMENLIEYRNYMPASVLHDDEAGPDVVPVLETSMRRSVHGVEANVKRLTLLTCNMLSFLSVDPPTLILERLTHYLAVSLSHVMSSKGIPDGFNGDRLYASWNGAKSCCSHRTAAYTCSRGITQEPHIGGFSIGLVSGEVRCGNMGCDGMKKYTFIGSLASWVHIVERVGRTRGSDIAIDQNVHDEVSGIAFTRYLQHVYFPKHADHTLMVYEAMDEKKVREAEWMYQLAEGENQNPHCAFNESYRFFMKRDIEGAILALQNYHDDSRVTQRYKDRLSQALIKGTAEFCDPYGTYDPLVS